MQHRFRRSELELRGPRNGLSIYPRSFRSVRYVPLFALILGLTRKGAVLEVPKASRGGSPQEHRGKHARGGGGGGGGGG
eukprot:13910586-Alexandrium_andersonii.AAC.1